MTSHRSKSRKKKDLSFWLTGILANALTLLCETLAIIIIYNLMIHRFSIFYLYYTEVFFLFLSNAILSSVGGISTSTLSFRVHVWCQVIIMDEYITQCFSVMEQYSWYWSTCCNLSIHGLTGCQGAFPSNLLSSFLLHTHHMAKKWNMFTSKSLE